jgi:SWI/SNF-related matrix-associated actin-dependent regulator of chromatin subfamily A-like protein 1
LDGSDGKIFIGTIHNSIRETLLEKFPGSLSIHGGQSAKKKQEVEKKFRRGKETRILIGQIQAAGVGLNLPEASTVAFVEYPWSPGALEQFIDRVHRVTSTKDVDVYFLVASNTIESILLEILQKKQKILDKVLDGKFEKTGEEFDLFTELQKAMEEKKNG